MNTDSTGNTELARLSRAVRFGLASVVLGLSYPNIHCALTLKEFLSAFSDLNLKVPGGAAFMLDHQPLFVGLSILFPVAAIASIFTPGIVRSIYLSGFLVIAVFIQLFFQWFTMMGPISNMTK